MRKAVVTFISVFLFASALSAQTGAKKATSSARRPAVADAAAPAIKLDQPPGLYAVFETTMGRIVCRLFPDKAPETVRNFVGLARGTKRWYDLKTQAWAVRRYYDGLTFHRVIPNFMIQGGDQLGNGTGGVGYNFKDEFNPDLKFDSPGKLAMANSGPNTNGAQFFITVAPTEWLNNHHTIFGEVVEGQSLADAISQTARDSNDKPNTPVVMTRVDIVDTRPPAAAAPEKAAAAPKKTTSTKEPK
ncbi:MAG: peptidylprolyl isomerase [Acidobacteriia bacterium]|nr:peptidylprolyl isomerase [Terriglobia bacterium]